MFSQAITDKVQLHFPQVQILTKDTSFFMKMLGTILFFTPSFMTDYITTIGFNIYFPSEAWVEHDPAESLVCLLHELVHVTDANKLTRPVFEFLYLLPLSLSVPAFLLFLLSWKIALPVILLCALPLPAYFRMNFEKRAYFAGLYASFQMNKKGHNFSLEQEKTNYISQFTTSAYYFMWPFSDLSSEFDAAISLIQSGQRPYTDPLFDVLDDILTVA